MEHCKWILYILMLVVDVKGNETVQNLYIDHGDTVVLKCTCSEENKSSWSGPDKKKDSAFDEEASIAYAYGLTINPYLNDTDINAFGSYTTGECNLRIHNFGIYDEGIYKCHFATDGILFTIQYNVFTKSIPTNISISNATDNNVLNGMAGQTLYLECNVHSGKPNETLKLTIDDNSVAESGPGTVVYKFIPSRFDNFARLKCSVYSPLLVSPLEQEIILNIMYKPFLSTTIIPHTQLIEGKSVELCCSADGNPGVILIWWLKENVTMKSIADNRCCMVFTPLHRNHSGLYKCSAVNSLGTTMLDVEFTVQYPPDVSVHYSKQELEESMVRNEITCNASGLPDSYSYFEWEHTSKYHEHIRWLSNTEPGTLSFYQKTDNPKSYFDNGFYICMVSNGVPDTEGSRIQKESFELSVEGPPDILPSNSEVTFVTYGENTNISVQVYSHPELTTKTIKRSMNYDVLEYTTFTEEAVQIKDYVHGKLITLLVSKITFNLVIRDKKDLGIYWIMLCNLFGCTNFTTEIYLADYPRPPTIFTFQSYCNSLLLKWRSNFNDGPEQIYVIEYRMSISQLWIAKKLSYEETTSKENLYILSRLKPLSTYIVRMYSKNKVGKSNKTRPITISIGNGHCGIDQQNCWYMSGSIATGFLLCFIVSHVCCVCRRQRAVKQTSIELNEIRRSVNYDEIGPINIQSLDIESLPYININSNISIQTGNENAAESFDEDQGSSLCRSESGYENSYQPLSHNLEDMHLYKRCISGSDAGHEGQCNRTKLINDNDLINTIEGVYSDIVIEDQTHSLKNAV